MRLSVRFIGCIALLLLGSQCFAQSKKYYIYGIDHAQYFTGNDAQPYYIVLGAFTYKEYADKLYQSLKPTFRSINVLPSNGMYRVIVGPLYSANEVRRTGIKLAERSRQFTGRSIPSPHQQSFQVQRFPAPQRVVVSKPLPIIEPMPIKKLIDVKPRYVPPPVPVIPVKTTNILTRPWYFSGNFGFTQYTDMYQRDGETMLGRFAIGRMFFERYDSRFGLEAGVQSGNIMRLSAPQNVLDELGGLPIQSTVKPMVDLLVVMQNKPQMLTPWFVQVKAGLAYRSWEFSDRNSVNDLYQLAGEIQAGIGYQVNDLTSLSLLYQGVFGGKPGFTVDGIAQTGHVNNIPFQNGVLLELSLHV